MPPDKIDAAVAAAKDFLGKNSWWNDPKTSEKALRLSLMYSMGTMNRGDTICFTGRSPEQVIAQARAGDRIAHDALIGVGDDLVRRGVRMPAVLANYFVTYAKQPLKWKSGRHPISELHRNDAIFRAVEFVVSLGFEPTRNDSTKADCASSIVAAALGGKPHEKRVAEIWTERRRLTEKIRVTPIKERMKRIAGLVAIRARDQ